MSYATGTFSVNGPATINAKAVSYSAGTPRDTTYLFETDASNQATFTLPIGIKSSIGNAAYAPKADESITVRRYSQKRYVLKVPFFFSKGLAFVTDYCGKKIATSGIGSDGIVIVDVGDVGSRVLIVRCRKNGQTATAKLVFSQGKALSGPLLSDNSQNGSAAHKSSASAAVYTIKLVSKSTSFGDTDNVSVSLVEGANGTKKLTLPSKSVLASERFKELVTEAKYNTLFPNRYGLGKAAPISDGKYDFYTYASLLKAIDQMANVVIKIVQRDSVDYCQKVIWQDKTTGVTRTMITGADYNASWNIGVKEDTVAIVDYAKFCSEGTLTIRQRELAAFFANISHETTGMGEDDATKTWGLYWIEEVAWQTNPNNTTLGYVDASNTVYPPVAGKSYHGRGPIQISWNYNYGQVSEFLYGDKNVFLQSPEKVLSGGDVAFMTAIWFWMTPQYPKPSCHDIMCEKWQPNSADIAAKRDKSRFGNTVNVINGDLECNNNNPSDTRVTDRIGFYKRYASIFAITTESECGCYMMKPY